MRCEMGSCAGAVVCRRRSAIACLSSISRFCSAWIGTKRRVGASLAVWTPGSRSRSARGSPGYREPPRCSSDRTSPPGDRRRWSSATGCTHMRCETQGLEHSCRLARVPLAAALDRSAWQFFAGNGRWSSNWKDARPVLQGGNPVGGLLSVHWNPFLGKFLAICSRLLDARIAIRFADRPEGPWSDADRSRSTPCTPGRDGPGQHGALAIRSSRGTEAGPST